MPSPNNDMKTTYFSCRRKMTANRGFYDYEAIFMKKKSDSVKLHSSDIN
jgi:hypothetical protein